jgi:ketosteroid isomerase-like protein
MGLLLGLALAGCGTPAHTDATAVVAIDSARALFASVPAALAAGGPIAWLGFFEGTPAFFMASDGAIAFADRVSAERFLGDLARQVAEMSLEWHEPRYEHLGGDVVVVTASYDEAIRMVDGTVSSFGGRVSGVIRRREGAWRFQHLHWSSPVAPAP